MTSEKTTAADTRSIERDDEGSALLLALLIVTLIGVMLAGVLSLTDTALVATPKFVSTRNTLHDADGAVDAAINSIRGSSVLGSEGGPSCDYTPPVGSDGVTVNVVCQPQAGSGSTADDQPNYAILTVGSTATGGPGGRPDGFYLTGNDQLTVDGGVYSHGSLDLTLGGNQTALQVYGDIVVEKGCVVSPGQDLATQITTTAGLFNQNCNVSDPRGTDPGYPNSVSDLTGLSIDPRGTCSGTTSPPVSSSQKVVTFQPGVYTEVPTPVSACSSNSVWWFSPGTYYFDFPDTRATWMPDNLSGKTVVGGTLVGGHGSDTLISALPFPGACDPNASGVQFMFGGSSVLSIATAGAIEVCGSTDATHYLNQRIVATTLKPGVGTRTPVSGTVLAETGVPVTPAVAGNQPFVDLVATTPPGDQVIDNKFSTATLISPGTFKTGDVSFPSFAGVPAGSAITSVVAKVRHYEGDPGVTSKLLFTLPSGTVLTKTLSDFTAADCALAVNCTDTWDITSGFANAYPSDQLNGIQAGYSAQAGGNLSTTDSLDGVQLVVTYTPPGLEPSHCPSGSPNCATFELQTGNHLNVFFHGTVYAPNSLLSLTVFNTNETVFDRGVIARSMLVNVSAASKQLDSPFRLPRATTGRKVLFIGRVNGVDQVRSLVTYQDFIVDPNTGNKVASPGAVVSVQRWSVLR